MSLADIAIRPPAFFPQGLCFARPELIPLFFPDDDDPAQCQEARQYCRRCPVATQCRDYAIDNEIHHGLWGGLTPRERERYRRNPAKFVLHLVACEECGKSLTGHQRLFCSQSCVRRASRRRSRQGQILPVNCRQCGKEFARRNPSQVLCSPECRKASVDERQRIRRAVPRVIGCWICGAPVERMRSRDKYCSDSCRLKARANQRKGA